MPDFVLCQPSTVPRAQVIKWGADHIKETASQCCAACRAHEKCNVWVYCEAAGGCGKERKHGECWLKRQTLLNPERPTGPRAPSESLTASVVVIYVLCFQLLRQDGLAHRSCAALQGTFQASQILGQRLLCCSRDQACTPSSYRLFLACGLLLALATNITQ